MNQVWGQSLPTRRHLLQFPKCGCAIELKRVSQIVFLMIRQFLPTLISRLSGTLIKQTIRRRRAPVFAAEHAGANQLQQKGREMSIFGAAFDTSTGRWIAFNEETLTTLSEHDTKAQALEACRRYVEREVRCANILHYVARHAI